MPRLTEKAPAAFIRTVKAEPLKSAREAYEEAAMLVFMQMQAGQLDAAVCILEAINNRGIAGYGGLPPETKRQVEAKKPVFVCSCGMSYTREAALLFHIPHCTAHFQGKTKERKGKKRR